MIVTLTAKGRRLMQELFPQFNQHEQRVLENLSLGQKRDLTESLRKITAFAEGSS
jgi:DNA-binding MarR family transcriptional regulator